MRSRLFQFSTLVVLLVFGLGACQDHDADLGDMPSSIFGDGSGDLYQAEDRSNQSGCSQKTNHAGYTGEGFMDFGGNGTWIEWNNVDVAIAGDYTLTFRYANARTSGRQAAAIVNGQNKGNVAFGGTGSWTTWETDTITVSLREGLNTIRVQANTGSGGPNLDAMEVSADDLCPDDPNKTVPGDCGCGVPEGDCDVVAGNGLSGTYFNNMDLTGQVLERVDPTVNFNWGKESPDDKMDGNTFSVRWTGFVKAKYSEAYTFYTLSDDGMRLWVDNDSIIDNWTNHSPTENSGTIRLEAGQSYEIKMEYYENGGGAVAKLLWSSPSQGKQIIPESSLSTTLAGKTLCVDVPERGSSTLSCPGDEVVDSIEFASYGTPTGTCDTGFDLSSCHAASSLSELEDACLDEQSCTVAASNGLFGDPCRGTFKRLAVVYTCSGGGIDNCPDDPKKIESGICGCGVADVDSDDDGALDCEESCPDDPNKTEAGDCGCGVPEGTCDFESLCATANEGSQATLACTDGLVIARINFASYGTPQGSCENGFTEGGCHSFTSKPEVESDCLGQETCTISASNTVFGDPCSGTGKHLYVDYDCADEIIDLCPDDPDKLEPGDCGCGNPEDSCEVPNYSKLVYPDENGTLEYAPDENGNTIPDFSYVGYKNGERSIPNVAVVKTISPIAGDNRAHIQNAINQVGNTSLKNGIRGALLLRKGEYQVSGTLNISKSGIVIRGEGNGENDTRIIATKRTKHDLFMFSGSGGAGQIASTKVKILGSYIPTGARTFTIQSHTFKAGDEVFLTRVPKQSWIAMLGMDKLENDNDPDDFNWSTSEYTMNYKRVVKGVYGNQITLDAPLVDPIDQDYATGYIAKYNWSKKITNVGIENIRLISEYSGDTDESHGWNAVVINQVQDGWVRNIESHYFGYSAVNVLRGGYRISILNSKQMYPKSLTKGGRKYSFAVNGELVLVKDCFAHGGRHDFVGHARTPGPNVFVNCTSENQKSDIGPHHRWSTGMLFDNIKGTRDMAVQNRMYSGSGHGWSGAQILFWNSVVSKIIIQSPPNHINWAIGNKASVITSQGAYANVPGYTESNNKHVWPQSIYEQQLKDRLGYGLLCLKRVWVSGIVQYESPEGAVP